MNKNDFVPTPPMGWNSYDYYNTAVNEEQVLANAAFMAEHLRQFGWEYVVVDIQWYAYDTGTEPEFQYIPFGRVEMDEYSRLIPCPDKFPSAEGGKGFGPLADRIHAMGLKFGIHIMRGIPREAAHRHGKILGSEMTADRVADSATICFWNPDMYGVRTDLAASQAYYDSLFRLYAQWGVDFVKCDDICREDMASAHEEIRMLHEAIMRCGRPIVLSLSPGPAKIQEAQHYKKYANMWRITDDFWDTWPLLKEMFRRCDLWQGQYEKGSYPDCDMLPVGRIGGCFGEGAERLSGLTTDEQKTMMTLWTICGSPLMIGGELTMMRKEDLSLLTNEDILLMHHGAERSRQLSRDTKEAVWASLDEKNGTAYLAIFNLADEERGIILWNGALNTHGFPDFSGKDLKELWTGQQISVRDSLAVTVPAHGVSVFSWKPETL